MLGLAPGVVLPCAALKRVCCHVLGPAVSMQTPDCHAHVYVLAGADAGLLHCG